jgi:type IV pilus assembly protein PilA
VTNFVIPFNLIYCKHIKSCWYLFCLYKKQLEKISFRRSWTRPSVTPVGVRKMNPTAICPDSTHQNKQHGFTLIELMIVVAIVGILAAIAIPAYKDHIIRARLSEALAIVGACKTSVFEYYSQYAIWPVDVTKAGCSNTPTAMTVTGISIVDGIITARIGSRSGIAGGCDIVLTPNSDGSAWTGSTDCPTKYVPSNFR